MLTTLRRELLDTSKKYLLRDLFQDDAAAGSVNDTPASGGPGVRTVVDTENKLSIAGGVLSFAGGKAAPSNGDPGLFWNNISPRPGLALISTLSVADVTKFFMFGWGTGGGATPAVQQNGLRFGSGGTALKHFEAASMATICDVANNTTYAFAIVLRSPAGSLTLVRGGAFASWTLLWVSSTSDTIATVSATVRASFANNSAAFTVDNVRIPAQLWLPSPLASDAFTRANGALGSTDGLGHVEQNGGNGLAWQYDTGTWTVAGNVAVGTPTLGSELIVNGGFDADTNWTKETGWTIAAGVATHVGGISSIYESVGGGGWYQATFDVAGYVSGYVYSRIGATYNGLLRLSNGSYLDTGRSSGAYFGFQGTLAGSIDNASFKALTLSSLFASVAVSTPDVLAEAAVTLTAGTQAGLVLNLDSAVTPANFVIAYHNGTNCLMEKCVAGVYTTVISAAATYSAGAVLRVIKDGTAYRLYYSDALVGTGTISDAGIVSNLSHGLFSTYSGNSFDNYILWARGTGNEYSALDVF